MKLSQFTYDYPKELIARHPITPRDHARLMVVHAKERRIEHRHVFDLPTYFSKGDVMVVNNTKVFPARLMGENERGAKIEIFLLRPINPVAHLWDVMAAPAKKVQVGGLLRFEAGLTAEVIDKPTDRSRTIRFLIEGDAVALNDLIDQIGRVPIPPYLKRPDEESDKTDYQTIFAAERGAVAAPTAGLHFTPEIIQKLKEKGVVTAPLTLHVGIGTFRSVEVEEVEQHRMDAEMFIIRPETAEVVNEAVQNPERRITVIGTTAVRAVESNVTPAGALKSGMGWTDKFIYPRYDFAITQRLMTNFHMPESTLLMLVSALAGDVDFMLHCYKTAVQESYRLFSYGDAMLIV